MADYDRRALARAYADVHQAGGHRAATRVYHQQILSGLQDLFEVTLEPAAVPAEHRPLFDLFESTVASLGAARTPWDEHQETGPIHRCLEQTGQAPEIAAASDRIKDLVAQSREAHLDILAALLSPILGAKSAAVFTSADLRDIGVDDTPPNGVGHQTYWET